MGVCHTCGHLDPMQRAGEEGRGLLCYQPLHRHHGLSVRKLILSFPFQIQIALWFSLHRAPVGPSNHPQGMKPSLRRPSLYMRTADEEHFLLPAFIHNAITPYNNPLNCLCWNLASVDISLLRETHSLLYRGLIPTWSLVSRPLFLLLPKLPQPGPSRWLSG